MKSTTPPRSTTAPPQPPEGEVQPKIKNEEMKYSHHEGGLPLGDKEGAAG